MSGVIGFVTGMIVFGTAGFVFGILAGQEVHRNCCLKVIEHMAADDLITIDAVRCLLGEEEK